MYTWVLLNKINQIEISEIEASSYKKYIDR